ncbi:MAG: RnfABCDGE type electron transport complex subunit D [Xanthomonadales bacterium]|nr:RnfABCDGE type electron transport complex subunit D [Xanthomonadales bacterium]
MRIAWRKFALLAERFFWSSPVVTRSAPHIRDAANVQRLWNYFVLASLPAWLIGLWSVGNQTNLAIADFQLTQLPGWRAWLLERSGLGFDAFSPLACFAHGLLYFLPLFLCVLFVGACWEVLFATVRKRRLDEGLLAIAWFFALLMPAGVPLHLAALGMSFAIVVGKLIYGGSGRYLVNPALLGLAFLVFSWPGLLFGPGTWVPVAGYDQPSVLELVATEGGLSVVAAVDYGFWQLFLGDRPGAFGTVSTLGIALGALFLVRAGVASWRLIIGGLIGVAVGGLAGAALFPGNVVFTLPWHWQLVLGGFAFGLVFLATDPVAGPMTDKGRWGFGLLVGGLTVVFRGGSDAYYEAVMFAILLASLFAPLIDFVVKEANIRRRRRRLRDALNE